MEAYPDAKVVLTVRDPVKWYNSVKNTIYNSRVMNKDPLVRWYAKLVGISGQWNCSIGISHGNVMNTTYQDVRCYNSQGNKDPLD